MDQLTQLINLTGFPHITSGMLIMWGVVGVLLYLAVRWQFEPLLLIPIAFGALLANLPTENLLEEPAGEIVVNSPGVIHATALKSGNTFKIPTVPIEIAEHLSRFNDPAEAKKLFQDEYDRVQKGRDTLAAEIKDAQLRVETTTAALAAQKDGTEAYAEASRKLALAKKTLADAQNALATQRTGIIAAVIKPEAKPGQAPTPTIADADIATATAAQQWEQGWAITVPWKKVDGTDGTLAVTREHRVLSAPATGNVVRALADGTAVRKGTTIGQLYSTHVGGLYHFIKLGILWEIFPPLIFLGIGALTDFGPLIANPKTLLLGAAAQLGVFFTFIVAVALFGFTAGEAAAVAIIGGADGPTSILLANKLAPHLMAAIAVAAYSYMALVPLIQPPIMRALTTEKERKIRMTSLRKVGRLEKLVFALVVTVLCILLVPPVAPLIGMLMLGNFFRESGVTERLTKTAQNELINIVTIFLGTSVGITMTADRFLRFDTLKILMLGVVAFGISTAGGILMAKVMNLFLKQKINPLIGSAGVSAVPMAARVSQVEGQKADPTNFLLMHAMGPNVSGVIGTAIAAGFFISILGGGH
jgi:oxaloacetate decarboxylase beta subunit